MSQLICRKSFYFNRIQAITELIFGHKFVFFRAWFWLQITSLVRACTLQLRCDFFNLCRGSRSLDRLHYSKFCKIRNFVNIQPNFLSARKKKDQPLRLVYAESKIVSVRAYNHYSIYIRIKSFILLAALRRSV